MPFQPYFFNDTPNELEQIVKNSEVNDKQSEQIAALEKILPELNENIANVVTEKLNEWNEDGSLRTILNTHKYLIVGDSYVAGANLPSPTTQNFAYLLAYQGFDVSALASSGGGFVAVGDNGTFYTMINGYNNDDTDSYTNILFLGGVNDSYQPQSGLKNNIINTVALTRQKFPNAKIHIGYISQLRREDGNPLAVNSCIQLYKTACLEAQCAYINNAEYMLKSSIFISSDGIHPSVEGQRIIANYLTSYFLNGNVSTFQQQPSIPFVLSSNFNTGVLQGNIVQDNGITRLCVLNSTAFVPASDVQYTFDGTTSFFIGQLNGGLVWGQSASSQIFSSAQATVPGAVAISDTADGVATIYPVAFTFRIVQKSLFLCPILLSSPAAYKTGYLKQINIAPFTAVFSTLDV